jgi:hypothetical protein
MKKYFLILILFSVIVNSQTYTITKNPTYGQYTPSTYTVKQTKTAADYIRESSDNTVKAIQASAERRAIRESAEIQARAQVNSTQSIIDNQNRIEEERKQEQKKELLEKRRLEDENNPNSILNKFRNANLKKENEDLKNKLIIMEALLKEKSENQSIKKTKNN